MQLIPYLLLPVLAGCLAVAQAMWGTAIKQHHVLQGSIGKIIGNVITSPRMWAGVIIYIIATMIYFYMLSRLRFFSVQISMTALAIVFSTVLAIIVFHERPDTINIIGGVLVIIGAAMVLYK